MKHESTAVGEKNGSTTDQSAVLERLSHLSLEPNPVLMEHAKQRAMSVQNRIADRITILRNGSCVYTGLWGSVDQPGIIRHMVGRDIKELFPKLDPPAAEVARSALGGSALLLLLRSRYLEKIALTPCLRLPIVFSSVD